MLNTDALGSVLSDRLNLLITWLLTSGVRVVLLLVATFVFLRVIRLLTDRFAQVLQRLTPQSLEGRKRVQTLSSTVRAVANTVLLLVMTMLILGEIGLNIGPLIAAAGIGGLAIGFGAQNLVRDVITGFFIILEDQIRVGDTVKVGDKSGQVERLGLRLLVLRDSDGSLHMIPNGTIQAVTNMTKGFSYAVLGVTVPADQDVNAVTAVLKEVGTEMCHDSGFTVDILGSPEVVEVNDLPDGRTKLTIRLKTAPAQQGRVSYELRRRIKRALGARGMQGVEV